MATLNIYDANDVIKAYKTTQENFFKTQEKKPPAKYNSLTKLLERSPLMGSIKYGDNFIG